MPPDNNTNIQDNNQSILQHINDVITNTSNFNGPFVKVGLVETSVQNIIGALKGEYNKNRESEGENSREQGKTIAKFLGNSLDGVGEGIKKLAIAQGKLEDIFKRNFWLSPFQNIFKRIPVIGKYIKFFGTVIDSFYSLQLSNLNVYKELIQNGVLYRDSFKQMHEDAGQLGMSLDELKETLVKNNTFFIRLGALTGDSSGAFTKLTKSVKETSIRLGLDMKDSIAMATTVAQNMYDKMEVGSDSFDRLIQTTNSYQKFLQKLSLATGKSVEELNKANDAREKEIAFQAWQKNSKNAPVSAFLKAIGASPELINAFVRGMPNEAFVKAGALSPEMARILQRAMEINNNERLSMEEKAALLEDLLKTSDREALLKPLNYNRAYLSEMGKIVGSDANLPINIATSDWDKIDFSGTNETITRMSEFKMKIIQIFEKIKGAFSLDSDTINGSTNFMVRLNNFLDEMLNDDNGKLNRYLNNINTFVNNMCDSIGKLFDDDSNMDFSEKIKIHIFGAEFLEEKGRYENWSELFERLLEPVIDGIINGAINVVKKLYSEYPISTILGITIGSGFLGIPLLINAGINAASSLINATSSIVSRLLNVNWSQVWDMLLGGMRTLFSGLRLFITSPVTWGAVAFAVGGYVGLKLAEWDDKEAKKKDKKSNEERRTLYSKLEDGTITDEEIEILAKNPTEHGAMGTFLSWFRSDEDLDEKVADLKEKRELAKQNHEAYLQKVKEDEMKAREESIKEQEKQKEELKKKLEDVQSENQKNALDCLRSIDTKLDILMNLDGKYDDIINTANVLKNNQVFANMEVNNI